VDKLGINPPDAGKNLYSVLPGIFSSLISKKDLYYAHKLLMEVHSKFGQI